MRIVESSASLVDRCQKDFNIEVEKYMTLASAVKTNTRVFMQVVRVFRVIHTRLSVLERQMIRQEEEVALAQNRFHKCTSVSEVIAQAVGAGSASWVGGTGSAEFDSEEASAISNEAEERIRQLTGVKA